MVIKLSYFDTEGFVEPIRLALKFAGVDFVDNRIKYEDWNKLKETFPNGTVPTLEVDGKVMTQNYAIFAYVGFKYDLFPSDHEKIYNCDEIHETVEDARKDIRNVLAITQSPESCGIIDLSDELRKARIARVIDNMVKRSVPDSLRRLDEIVPNTGFLDGGKVTIADIQVYCHIRILQSNWMPIPTEICDKYKNLMSIKEKFENMKIVRNHFGLTRAKLTCLDIEGISEPARIALKLSGIDFEERILSHEQWATVKHTMKNNLLPILSIDGKVIQQTKEILRYLAENFSLVPDNSEVAFNFEEIFKTIEEMNEEFAKSLYGNFRPQKSGSQDNTAEKRAELIRKMKENAIDGTLPSILEKLNTLIGKSGIVNGEKVTIGDIFAYSSLRKLKNGYLDSNKTDIFTKQDKLVSMMKIMGDLDIVKTSYR